MQSHFYHRKIGRYQKTPLQLKNIASKHINKQTNKQTIQKNKEDLIINGDTQNK
jgi:hypothetical protein